MFCACDKPLPEPDTLTCLKCGRASVAALMHEPKVVRVDPQDALLRYRRRVGYVARAN